MPSEVLQARAAVGVAARRRDPAAERAARRDLAAAKLAAFVSQTIAAAPPLTNAQRDRIVHLLRADPTPGGEAR